MASGNSANNQVKVCKQTGPVEGKQFGLGVLLGLKPVQPDTAQ